MNKKGVLVLTLLGILFVSACAPTGSTSSVEGAYNCFGDDQQMIEAEFSSFAPVSDESNPYAPGEEIDIEVNLKSKLPSDIEAGNILVRLTGDAAIPNIFSGAKVATAGTLFAVDSETCRQEDIDAELGPITYQGEITTKISREISGLYCYQEPVVVKAFLYYTGDANEIGTNLPSNSNPASSVQVTQIDQNPVNIQEDGTGEMRFKIFIENVGTGTIVENLDECFEFRETGYREELKIEVKQGAGNIAGGYLFECPDSVKLSRDEKTDVITCKITNIDAENLGPQASEITIILQDFAYEDTVPSTTIWIEP